jgi:hypothetical protein
VKRLLLLVVLLLAVPTAVPAHAASGLRQVASTTTEAPHVADEPLPDDEATDGSSAWLLVLMTIIVVVMVVLAIAFVRGRRPPA